MKYVMAIVIPICMLIGWLTWCNNRDTNGILRDLGKNVALIEGERIVITWDATEAEAEAGLRRWMELKK